MVNLVSTFLCLSSIIYFLLRNMDELPERSGLVQQLLERIETNMARRRQELDEDSYHNQTVAGKVMSPSLASIPGMQKHLVHMKNVSIRKSNEEVSDVWSHGAVRKGELYLKYQV